MKSPIRWTRGALLVAIASTLCGVGFAQEERPAQVDVVRLGERALLDLGLVDLDADPVLVVDGVPITQHELRHTLCMMTATNEIDQFTTFIISKRLQKEQGVQAPPVTDQQVQKAFEQQKTMAQQMGGVDAETWERQIREEFGWDRYVEFQKIQLGFEKLFLPEPPEGFMEAQAAKFETMRADWEAAQAAWKVQNDQARKKAVEEGRDPSEVEIAPPEVPVPEGDLSWIPKITLELLEADFAKVLQETYARGQPMHPMLHRGLVNTLKFTLLDKTEILFAGDSEQSLPEGALFTVDGEPVAMDTIYSLIKSRIDDTTRRLALRELLALRAADKALAARGFLASPAEAKARYEAMAQEYEGSLIPLAQAIMLRGFPNEHHYRRYFRRKAAFRALVESTASEEDLRHHFEKAGHLFYAGGAVTGQALFVPGDTEDAAMSAMNAALMRVADGEDFTLVAREVGKFPPNRESRAGEFTGLVRNRLRQFLKESEYTAFVLGYSLSDELFYTGKEGDVMGPIYRDHLPEMRGALAVKILDMRSAGVRRTFEESRPSVLEDLADLTFTRFVNDALGQLQVELPSEDSGSQDGK